MKHILLLFAFIWSSLTNILLAQEDSFSLIVNVDYTIPELEIINEEFKSCLDTFSITPQEKNKEYPYLILSFDPELVGPQLCESEYLPPERKGAIPPPLGYVEYKGYPLIIEDTPPKNWFRKTGRKKRFKGTVWIMPGGGGKLWMLILEKDKIVKVLKGYNE